MVKKMTDNLSYVRAYRSTLKGRVSRFLSKIKHRAATARLAFNLDRDWFISRFKNGCCEVTGLPFDFRAGKHPNTPSVDRIDSIQGYTKDNCQLVIWIYNAAKQNYGAENVLQMANALIDIQQTGICA